MATPISVSSNAVPEVSTPLSSAIYDDLSRSVVTYLETHAIVKDIRLTHKQGVTDVDFAKWESRNGNCQLPLDLKAFLATTDGLDLRWSVQIPSSNGQNNDSRIIPLGCMHINGIEEVKPVRLVSRGVKSAESISDVGALVQMFHSKMVGHACSSPSSAASMNYFAELNNASILGSGSGHVLRAFCLDSTCQTGRVCLVYCRTGGHNAGLAPPQVWFQDRATNWHYVANNFGDYFRLVILHLGIPNWQYVFTDSGLDPNAQQWLRYFSPQRMQLNMAQVRDSSKLLGTLEMPFGNVVGRGDDAGHVVGKKKSSSTSSDSGKKKKKKAAPAIATNQQLTPATSSSASSGVPAPRAQTGAQSARSASASRRPTLGFTTGIQPTTAGSSHAEWSSTAPSSTGQVPPRPVRPASATVRKPS